MFMKIFKDVYIFRLTILAEMSTEAGTMLFAPRLLRDIRLTLATPEHVWKLCKIR